MPRPDHGNMVRDPRDEWPADEPVGSFDIAQRGVQGYPGCTAHIMFVCPSGKRCTVFLGPAAVDRPSPEAHCVWAWDGNLERPTLTPSINCVGGCGWHGHITNGVIR